MPLNRYLALPTIAVLLGAALWAAGAGEGERAATPQQGSVAGASSGGLLSYLAAAGPVAPPPLASADALRRQAARLPADFQADVLLRLAAGPEARDAADLILQAYRLAPQAARPLPGRVARAWAGGDDVVLPPQTAGLDQLSLQIRAVRAMLAIAPERIGMLSSPFPGPRAADCDADYVDDPGAVYELASATLPAQAYARAAFALKVVSRARTEMDLAPAVQFITALPPLAPRDEAALAQGLSALFARAQGNDPGFAATGPGLASGMEALLARYNGMPDARREVQAAFRNYVATHLAAARCPASLGGEYRQLERGFTAGDNADAADAPDTPDLAPRAATAPAPYAAAADAIRHAAATTMARLHAGPDASPSEPPDADDLLATLDSAGVMSAAAGDAGGRLQRIAVHALLRYLEYAPPGARRDGAFARLQAWLADGAGARDHDRRLADLRALADGARRWPDADRRLRQLAASRDLVISVYAQLVLSKQFP
ncbi:hypothetical protein JOD97_003184 [Duganella sp. 1411]|uniref:hypothetical protein n=1 Tax=Duganella sp. 1411 TaxID=2806572 RepID=UPI001AE123D7|nr:hypothetical protein [Duganella sp. 1411]MBP1205142.1 hypothetical protein [Duganella sp. 1411]